MYYIYPLKRIIIIFSILRLYGLCEFSFLIGYYSKDLIIKYFFLRKIIYFSIISIRSQNYIIKLLFRLKKIYYLKKYIIYIESANTNC